MGWVGVGLLGPRWNYVTAWPAPAYLLGPQPFDLSFFIIHHHLRVPLYFSYVSTMHISFDIEEEDKSPPHVLHAFEMEGRT